MTNSFYQGFRDLKVYKLSYQLTKEVFEATLKFPREEKFSLIDQVRRSSRSVPAIIVEAWYRRKYVKSFVNKLIEASGEAGETCVWLDFSLDHSYIDENLHTYLIDRYEEVGKMLASMINKPEKFCHERK
jgi:four helix bundle protein